MPTIPVEQLAAPYSFNTYKARMIRVLDGDTFEMDVDLGQKTSRRDHYRLARVQVWESSRRMGTTEEDKQKGLAVKAKMTAEFPPGSELVVTTAKGDKYGRFVIEAWYKTQTGWVNLNDRLLSEGVPGMDGGGSRIG